MQIASTLNPIQFHKPSHQPKGVEGNASHASFEQKQAAGNQNQSQNAVEPLNKTEKINLHKHGEEEALALTQQIQSLSKRDREVRTHEQIHASLAGPYGGSPQFQFQRGPDGVLYAVSGSVSLDASPIPGNPEATERKAKTIQRAALAPSDPSVADRAIAARAASMASQARLDINQEALAALEQTMSQPSSGSLLTTSA